MHITVFGASGKVGRQVVALALVDGHQVTVFVHSHNPFGADVRVVKGDVTDVRAVSEAVQGSDVVISTLGSWHTKTNRVLSDAMTTILPVMKEQGSDRIITLTGAGALLWSDKPTLFDKLNHGFLGLVASKILKDGEGHLRLLADSKLSWTCIRSPIMTKGSKTTYKLVNRLPAPWATIPRQAVAKAIIEQIANIDYLHEAPVIRRA